MHFSSDLPVQATTHFKNKKTIWESFENIEIFQIEYYRYIIHVLPRERGSV